MAPWAGSRRRGRRRLPGVQACPVGSLCYAATAGKATGLRLPAVSTGRRPNWTLSFEISSVTVVTLPTRMGSVRSAAVVSLLTTSYLARFDSGLAFQVEVVRLLPP